MDNDDMDDDELKLCGEVGRDARAFVRKYMQMRAYADELNARCIADAADAERYRWLRPSEGTGSAGSLAATERHLKDMQAVAMGLLRKEGVQV